MNLQPDLRRSEHGSATTRCLGQHIMSNNNNAVDRVWSLPSVKVILDLSVLIDRVPDIKGMS